MLSSEVSKYLRLTSFPQICIVTSSTVARRRIALAHRIMLTSWIVAGGSNIYTSSIRYSTIRFFVSESSVSSWIVIGLSEAFAKVHAKRQQQRKNTLISMCTSLPPENISPALQHGHQKGVTVLNVSLCS